MGKKIRVHITKIYMLFRLPKATCIYVNKNYGRYQRLLRNKMRLSFMAQVTNAVLPLAAKVNKLCRCDREVLEDLNVLSERFP